MGGGRVFKPFPGAGAFDWSISRIDAESLDGSLAVVGACFPWGVFVLVRPGAAEGFGTATKCGEGEELVSLLPFVCRCQMCQGGYPYSQR